MTVAVVVVCTRRVAVVDGLVVTVDAVVLREDCGVLSLVG